jgi:aminotransferase
LSLGQPHFNCPEAVKSAAIRAIQEDKNQYSMTGGVPGFAEAVKETSNAGSTNK